MTATTMEEERLEEHRRKRRREEKLPYSPSRSNLPLPPEGNEPPNASRRPSQFSEVPGDVKAQLEAILIREREDAAARVRGRRPRIVLAASGCPSAMRFMDVCWQFNNWADLVVVFTADAARLVDIAKLPVHIACYGPIDDMRRFTVARRLRDWADVLVIAPLSCNTFAKILAGMSDNLLTTLFACCHETRTFLAPDTMDIIWQSGMTELQTIRVEEVFRASASLTMPVVAEGHARMNEAQLIALVKGYFQLQQAPQ